MIRHTHEFNLPHTMGEKQTVGAEGAHFGTHLTKHRLGSIRACQAAFAAGALNLQGKQGNSVQLDCVKGWMTPPWPQCR